MMKTSGDSTRPAYPTDPKRFRAMATGIGKSQRASEATGVIRGMRVANDPASTISKAPACEGFQPSAEELMAVTTSQMTTAGVPAKK